MYKMNACLAKFTQMLSTKFLGLVDYLICFSLLRYLGDTNSELSELSFNNTN